MSSDQASAFDRYVVGSLVILCWMAARSKTVDGTDDQTDNCETGSRCRLTLDRIESKSWRVSASFTRDVTCDLQIGMACNISA